MWCMQSTHVKLEECAQFNIARETGSICHQIMLKNMHQSYNVDHIVDTGDLKHVFLYNISNKLAPLPYCTWVLDKQTNDKK